MKDKKSYNNRSNRRSNTHVVWRLTPNGCLTFALRIIGILFVIGFFAYLYISGQL